jgi:hypothetical protein
MTVVGTDDGIKVHEIITSVVSVETTTIWLDGIVDGNSAIGTTYGDVHDVGRTSGTVGVDGIKVVGIIDLLVDGKSDVGTMLTQC